MGQLIIESRIERAKVLESDGTGVFRFEAVVSEADYINQNRRMYPANVLFPAFEAVNTNIASHPGDVDHPDGYSAHSFSDLGIAWESFRVEGSQVIGVGRIVQTAKGKDLQAAMEAGIAVGFSTRGFGESEEQTIDGRTISVLTAYTLEAVDAVRNPSVGHARIRSYSKEETEVMNEELKAALEAKAAIEATLAEATAAVEAVKAQVVELEAKLVATEAEGVARDAHIATLEAAAAANATDALTARLLVLTKDHRFAPTIIAQAIELGVTLESADKVVTVLTGLVEAAGAKANDEATPRGDLSTDEDTALSAEAKRKHQDLVEAGLA